MRRQDVGPEAGTNAGRGSAPGAGRGGLAGATLSGLLWTVSGKGAGAVLQIAVLAVLARLLEPSDFGVVTAALIVVMFFIMMTRLGLGHALVQRAEVGPREISTAYWTSLLLGILLAALVWFLAPVFAGLLRVDAAEPVLRVLAFLFPLRALMSIAEALLQRRARFQLMAKIDVLSYAFGFGVCGVGAAWGGAGVWALVGAHYATALAAIALLLVFHAPFRLVAPDRTVLQDLLGYGGGVTIGKFINRVALEVDNVIVARWLGAAALGLYGRAYQLMAMPGNLMGEALDRVLFPTLSRLQEDTDRLRRAFLRGLSAVSLLTLPASLVAIVLAPELIGLLLGPGWEGAVGPFRFLALGLFFRTSYRISDSLAYATGAVYRRAWRQAAYAVCVAVAAWAGTRFGLSGVAAGVMIALALNYVLMTHLSLSLLGMPARRVASAQLPGLLLGLVGGGVAWTVAAALRPQGGAPLTVFAVFLAAGAAMVFLVWALPRIFVGMDSAWAPALLAERMRKFKTRSRTPDRSGGPVTVDLPERLALERDGVTERLVHLHVNVPREFVALDWAIRKEMRRYLPHKKLDTNAPCVMATTVSTLAWDPAEFGDEAPTAEEVAATYTCIWLATGASRDQAEDRLADVRRYTRAAMRGATFPPILLCYDSARLIHLDGARRLLASLLAGRTRIETILVVRVPVTVHAHAPRFPVSA
jgi:O-antigen/teichoic acid export membrane protein